MARSATGSSIYARAYFPAQTPRLLTKCAFQFFQGEACHVRQTESRDDHNTPHHSARFNTRLESLPDRVGARGCCAEWSEYRTGRFRCDRCRAGRTVGESFRQRMVARGLLTRREACRDGVTAGRRQVEGRDRDLESRRREARLSVRAGGPCHSRRVLTGWFAPRTRSRWATGGSETDRLREGRVASHTARSRCEDELPRVVR